MTGSEVISRPWRAKALTPQAAEALAAELGVPLWVAQVLCHRGYLDKSQAQDFLAASLAGLPEPHRLTGMAQALEVLVPAITQGRTIGVAGDYDADGVTATALLVDFLRQLRVPVVWDLPHRITDGYGFLPSSAQRLAQAGAQVIITVDCGVSDHQGVAAAQALGMQVVVTDHHQIPPGPLVPAQAVINPHLNGSDFWAHLAGVGVAFYLAAALRAALREAGYFRKIPPPNLRHSLDLVALGTLADLVPLLECNRVLVREGLKVLNELRRPAFRALATVAGYRNSLDARDVSFGLVPRINAAGRLDHPSPALRLLLSSEPGPAWELAQVLDQLNRQRREVEREVFAQALTLLESAPGAENAPFVVLSQPGWHRGVLGIVASRLVESLRRPVMLFSLEDDQAIGSGRSVPGFHLEQALTELSHLLRNYGGHALAAGASLPASRLAELSEGLNRAADSRMTPEAQDAALELEADVTLNDLGPQALGLLQGLSPFGNGNPAPLLASYGVRVNSAEMVGGGHLKLVLSQNGQQAQAIGFNWSGLQPDIGQMVDMAFVPRISHFGQTHIELVLEDMRPNC